MKKTGIILGVVLVFSLLFCNVSQAKREPPKEVEPVTYKGVKYVVPHWGWKRGRMQNGGYIEAWHIKKDKLLWELQVYVVEYNPDIESDVQDIFITSLKIEDGKLIIENEAGDRFEIDLDTREVSRK